MSLDLEGLRVFDGHNDMPWAVREILTTDPAAIDRFGQGLPAICTDLPRLRRGQVGAQYWAIYVPGDLPEGEMVGFALEQIDLVHQVVQANPDDLAFCERASDVVAARARGQIACLLGMEGGHALAHSLGVLRSYRRLGIRYLTLTHTRNNTWADSATDAPEHGGLNDFGASVIATMNEIGLIVDLSHVSPAVMRQAIALSTRPVMFSHSSCGALCEHPRNVPTDVLESLPTNGGLAMVTFVPEFLSPDYWEWAQERAQQPDGRATRPAPAVTLTHVADHLDRAREIAGVDHIGIGGDFDGTDVFPGGLEDVSTYPALLRELAHRGWSHDDLTKLTWENALRVLAANDEAVDSSAILAQ